MYSELTEILNVGIEQILNSSLHLKMLKIYSALYLNYGQPRLCAKSAKYYYSVLKKTGLERAKKYDEMTERKCIPKWNGLKFIPKMASHYSSERITDEQALMLLKKGFVNESDFEVLPDGYKVNRKAQESEQLAGSEKKEVSQKVIQTVKKRKRNTN